MITDEVIIRAVKVMFGIRWKSTSMALSALSGLVCRLCVKEALVISF
jgi:hypothetical protein